MLIDIHVIPHVHVQIRSEEFLLPVRNPQSMDSARISHLLLTFPPPMCQVAYRYGDVHA